MPLLPPLSCVIVDDNEINRLTLEHLASLNTSLAVQASLADGLQALRFLESHPPVDLLLLDVEMPGLSGLELLRLLPAPAPAVVLVTSHRGFAVEAFERRVIDYLLKPVSPLRFHQAVSRAMAQRAASPPAAPLARIAPDQALFVKVNNRMVRLDFGEVLFIEALSTYSVLVTPTQRHIVYATLKSLAERVPFGHFQRVHRSYIVNTHRIEVIEDNVLHLGPYAVPVGKSYQDGFLRSMRSL